MRLFTVKFEGADVVACVAIPCLSLLIYSGSNGAATALLATIVGWYFAKKSYEKKA